jgi:Galactose oxidase, central domain/Kelch motif
MKPLPPVINRVKTITLSLGRGRFEDDALCLLATMLGGRLALLLLLLCAALVQPCAGAPFQWEFTGSLNQPRAWHTATNTATLLYDGRVLVAGGAGPRPGKFPYPGLASSELYNPATGNWTVTGSLNDGRLLHTATLLLDGRVLVTGGWLDHTNHGELSSAELYNPATGNWTRTIGMHVPRVDHTATLLSNGRVLVVGSLRGDPHSTELYDPAIGNWSFTGRTTSPRLGYHTATLLPNKMVLVAAGYDGTNHVSANAELYDSATGTWTPTGRLAIARQNHTATLLHNGTVLVTGGANDAGILASAELYDPTTGTWTSTGSLNVARWEHTATLLCDGKVLVAGGINRETSVVSAEIYDPDTGNWTFTGNLNDARALHSATLLPGGRVLLTGGNSAGGGFLASAEWYNAGPTTGTGCQ